MLKKILLAALGLVVLYVVTLLIMPGRVYIERSADVRAQPEAVFEQVNNLKNWQNWSSWLESDPDAVVTYGDTFEGEGGMYAWDGPKSGSGTLTIEHSNPGESVHTLLDFGDMGTGKGYWTFTPKGNGTRVTWAFETELKGFNKLYRPMIKIGVGPNLRKGLENMDRFLAG